jgi:exoribonuclease-2
MSTTPAPHEGIGVAHYAWSTSPLRRYVDLVNQRQLIAVALERAPAYAANDADVFAIVSGFDSAYTGYADFQARLERYWCLRWLQQENVRRIGAAVVKDDLLRIDGLPLLTRLPGLPQLPRGQRIEIDVLGCDEVELSLHARLHQVLSEPVATIDDEELADDTTIGTVDALEPALDDLAAQVTPAGGTAAVSDPSIDADPAPSIP